MLATFRGAVEATTRMRWLIGVFVVGFSIEAFVTGLSKFLALPAGHPSSHPMGASELAMSLVTGAASSTSIFAPMGGHMIWVSAVFVLARFRWTRCWLKANAQLGKRTSLALWSIVVSAAIALAQPVLLGWALIGIGRGERVGWKLATLILSIVVSWFAACVAAFWQSSLYPVILQAWAGHDACWRDLNRQFARRWDSLRVFNFVAAFVIAATIGAVVWSLTLLAFHWQVMMGALMFLPFGYSAASLFIILVPFGMVIRMQPWTEALNCSFRAVVNRLQALLKLLIPLALGFAIIECTEKWLGSLTGAPLLFKVCAQPFNAVWSVFGLVSGTRVFDKLVPSADTKNVRI